MHERTVRRSDRIVVRQRFNSPASSLAIGARDAANNDGLNSHNGIVVDVSSALNRENTDSRIIRQSLHRSSIRCARLRGLRRTSGARSSQRNRGPDVTDRKCDADRHHQRDNSCVMQVHDPCASPQRKEVNQLSKTDQAPEHADRSGRRERLSAAVRVERNNAKKQNRNSQHHRNEQ